MKLPVDIIELMESKTNGVKYGRVRLDITFRHGMPRYELSQKLSIYDGEFQKLNNSGHTDQDVKK